MRFRLLAEEDHTAHDARYDESLIAAAAERGPVGCVWQARQSLVVPRTYQRYSGFTQVCEAFSAMGWPVSVRQSGGGIVPQGPGVINLSLAYAVDGKPLDHSDAAYSLLCEVMQSALIDYGIAACPGAVQGSFCDGRFNLATAHEGQARKVAGTAQVWRRHQTESGHPAQIVLVHGLILAHVDASGLTELANRFETALGRGRPYREDSVASLHTLLVAEKRSTNFCTLLKQTLAAKIVSFPA